MKVVKKPVNLIFLIRQIYGRVFFYLFYLLLSVLFSGLEKKFEKVTVNETKIINIEHCDDDEVEHRETSTRNEQSNKSKLTKLIKERAKISSAKNDQRGRRYRGPRIRRNQKHKDEVKEALWDCN